MTKTRSVLLVLCVAFALCTLFACAKTDPATPSGQDNIAVVTADPNANQEAVDAITKRLTMLDGVTIDGISVGGMTMEQAKAAVEGKSAATISVAIVIGDETVTLSQADVKTVTNLDDVLTEAFALVREDTGYANVSAAVEEIRTNGKAYTTTARFDEEALEAAVAALATAHDVLPVDATVSFDSETNTIVYLEETNGLQLDQAALLAALQAANNGDKVTATLVETQPELTKATLETQFVLRGAQHTSFKGSSKNRKFNINKGAAIISGTILHPNDEFSCNTTLGVRNKDNGWKMAGAYVGGAVDEQYGGGVCQLSSTLYNAVVKADLEIVDRRNHSMPVSYIDQGLDATINSVGNMIDFKFKNNTDDIVIIVAYTEGNTLYFEIYGKPFATDEYDEIRLRAERTKKLYPSGDWVLEVDNNMKPGTEEVVQERRNGAIYQSYKQYYKDGVLVREEPLATSEYKAFNGKKMVGPTVTASPSPEATAKPSATAAPDPTAAPNPTEVPIPGM